MLAISTVGFSQTHLTLSYTMSFSTGETNDFINKASFRGVSLDGRRFLNDNISLGGYTNWTTFYKEMPDASYTDGTITLSGVQYRYINSMPILFNAHYFTGSPDEGIRLYGGVGVGTYYINQRTDMGIWTTSTNKWHFGFAPEIGILVPTGSGPVINVSAKWNYALKAGDSMDYSWFGLNLGYVLQYY